MSAIVKWLPVFRLWFLFIFSMSSALLGEASGPHQRPASVPSVIRNMPVAQSPSTLRRYTTFEAAWHCLPCAFRLFQLPLVFLSVRSSSADSSSFERNIFSSISFCTLIACTQGARSMLAGLVPRRVLLPRSVRRVPCHPRQHQRLHFARLFRPRRLHEGRVRL